MSVRPRVCVLHVGGTIGMVRTATGFEPQPGFLQRYIAAMPEMERPELPAHDVVSSSRCSTRLTWRRRTGCASRRRSSARYEDYAGFVVVHGTDTMAYTASALSFLLPELRKPVILTGSQLSLEHVRSDGREHIITAILLAGTLAVPEVCIYFASRLLRGNRAQKIHNHDFVAFDSGNLPPLASVGVSVIWRPIWCGRQGMDRWSRGAALRARTLRRCGCSRASLRVCSSRCWRRRCRALVLETYGVGNAPSRDPALLAAISAATERDVVVVNCSQCHGGSVRQTLYSTGAALARCGVILGSRHDAGGGVDEAVLLAGGRTLTRAGACTHAGGPGR
jgi:L-asparaginase